MSCFSWLLAAIETLVRKLIWPLKAERSDLGCEQHRYIVKLSNFTWAIPPSPGPTYFYILLCRTHKFAIILQTSHVRAPLSFEVICFRRCKCQLPVLSIIIYMEPSRSEGEMMQAAQFCLVSSQERSAEPFKKDTLSKPNCLPKSTLQKHCKKAHALKPAKVALKCWVFFSYQKAPLATTCGVRTQSGQRMDRAHTNNCTQLHFVCFGDYFF